MKSEKTKTPASKLVTLLSITDPVTAELIKNMLADHKIQASIDGENQAGFAGALPINILVRESDAQAALEFVQIHFPEVN